MKNLEQELNAMQRQMQIFMRNVLEGYGISPTQMGILLFLRTIDGCCQEQLSREFQLDKSGVSRNLQALERQGYLIRVGSARDKRIKQVYLLEKGQKTAGSLQSLKDHWIEQLEQTINPADMQGFLRVMEQIAQSIRMTNEKWKKEETVHVYNWFGSGIHHD